MKRLLFTSLLLLVGAGSAAAADLQPFVASYQAYRAGALAGTATMRVVRTRAPLWRIDLDLQGDRGLAGLVGLDVAQSTVFDALGDGYRPLSQSTVRKAFLLRRKSVGTYDWAAGTARWTGDVKAERQAPIALQPGDMSGLLINLAILRDAEPGKSLRYRFVDGGRVRIHEYLVSDATENVGVGDLRYEALRVSRSNGGNDETIVWVADGVPTPVRILQRQDGEDGIDLRLIRYQGAK
ncbi:DUF3108 domain-containing protein [Luteimonas vadosa]|uniref:DUF3108 domain-containing protein n=1 Tax=Luteimonas vadosa TaxID=1165507 RepID=A0ABP9DWG3_9GAMM